MAQCAFCNATVDPQWATWASKSQTTIASGFDHANNIMLAARALIVLLVASFIPCGGIVAGIGFNILILIYPILVLIWFSKYQWGLQGIDKNHSDLKQARGRVGRASIIWGVMLFLRIAVAIIIEFPNLFRGFSD